MNAENLLWWEHCGRNQRNKLEREDRGMCGTKRDESGERIPKAWDLLPHWQLNGVCHSVTTSSPLPPQAFISTHPPPPASSSSVSTQFPPPLLPRSLSGAWQIIFPVPQQKILSPSAQHLWALAKMYTFCLGGKRKIRISSSHSSQQFLRCQKILTTVQAH